MSIQLRYNPQFPSVEDLRERARKRVPRFAFEYLDGGCNEEVNLKKNTAEVREVELEPHYLKPYSNATLQTELFGETYNAPFGIAPVGLQGLIWPNSPEILARAAHKHKIPFILSTVSTTTIERMSELTEGKAWFQLYHPAENELRDKLVKRAAKHCPVLVVLSDTPTFGYRSKEIKNGLAIPPRMTLSNILQILAKPDWALRTLLHGRPTFELLKPYIPEGMNMHHLGLFMNRTFDGRLSEDKVAALRDLWPGKLVMKGVVTEEDAEICVRLGVDGIIVSNHGGRQLDAGPSAIYSLKKIVKRYRGHLKIMMDSGLRSGPDVARALACGAEFTFMGRTFMYGVAALGKSGGEHTISITKRQLQQVMEQVGCESPKDFPRFLL